MSILFPELAAQLNWQISHGSEFLWQCWGPNCRFAEFDLGETQISVIFNTKTLDVYEVNGYLDKEEGACEPWRWVEPTVIDAYLAEYADRQHDAWIAWDDVPFAQVKTEEELQALISEAANAGK